MISDKKSVQDLVRIFLEKGITDIVFSPGSRNAPLSISFYNHPGFTCYNIPDERSAAFFALGMAQQLNKPVAICCTSGTAALNYSSAVCEAYYQRIPLVVLTADRPQEWINQGAGQSIAHSITDHRTPSRATRHAGMHAVPLCLLPESSMITHCCGQG